MKQLCVQLGRCRLAGRVYHEAMFILKQVIYSTVLRWVKANLTQAVAHLLIAFLLSLAMPLGASADTLFANDLQMRGEKTSYVIPVFIEGTQPKAVALKLHWNASSLVDFTRSMIHVSINGQIRSSRRLSDLSKNTWDVRLRPLRVGKHEIRIELQLRSKDDDCSLPSDALWVTFLSDSQISGAARSEQNSAMRVVAVRDVPENWRKTSSDEPAVLGKMHAVSIAYDFLWDRQMAAAFLQTQLFLRQNGFDNVFASDNKTPKRTLSIRSIDKLPLDHPAATRWRALKDPQYILFAPSPSQLEVIVQSPQDTHHALQVLANDDLRALCHENICSMSEPERKTSDPSDANSNEKMQSRLWSMLSSDQPRGWTAQGMGSHKLRQVWLRPASLELDADVYLHLAARVSQAAPVNQTQSSISLKINDQPIATYSLSDWKAGHAHIRIPSSLWQASVWIMDFEVRLVPQADVALNAGQRAASSERCTQTVQEDFWVTIDPDTRLQAKYNTRDSQSIAGFWQRTLERPVQSVYWNTAPSGVPSPQQLASLAPVLQMFQFSSTTASLARWAFVDLATCANQPCISLHPAAFGDQANSSQASLILPWRHLLKRIPEHAKNLPDLNAQASMALVWQPKDAQQAEQLHLVFGQTSNTHMPVPQLATFAGSVATYSDQWQVFAHESLPRKLPNGASAKSTGNVSEQQGRLRWINLLWALGSILLVTALSVAYWRKKKKADTQSWEVKE
jgi:Bacterial cellulose synthase subunit